MPPRNRRELVKILDDCMSLSYDQLKDNQALESKTSLVKTYLVESRLPEDFDGELFPYVAQIVKHTGSGKRPTASASKTEDSNLVTITGHHKGESVTLYADGSNPRFWQVHSVGNSEAVDWLIHRLVNAGPELDRAWFPTHLLEYVSTLGVFRGLSLDYDRTVIPDVDFQAAGTPVDVLKMQLKGNRAKDILSTLRGGAFEHQTTVAKVKIRFTSDVLDRYFTLDDVKYDGKITARGTSFDSHLELVGEISNKYSTIIRNIEARNVMSVFHDDIGLQLTGAPINIMFPQPIVDLGIFCDSVFSCAEPFRLWGVPVQVAKDFYRIRAVDLHVGSEVTFEVAPDWMRVYLPQGSCGNTVVRIFTNLQHHYDALIMAVDGDGGAVVGV